MRWRHCSSSASRKRRPNGRCSNLNLRAVAVKQPFWDQQRRRSVENQRSPQSSQGSKVPRAAGFFAPRNGGMVAQSRLCQNDAPIRGSNGTAIAIQMIVVGTKSYSCEGALLKRFDDTSSLKGRCNMLSWALTFLVIALIAGALGATGVMGTATNIAYILFVVFIVMFLISLVAPRFRPPVA